MVLDGTGLGAIKRVGSNNYSEEAKEVRNAFCNYFSSKEGKVPWQWHAYAVDVNKR